MHTAFHIKNAMFAIELDGQVSTREAILEWEILDRLGVVINSAYGALGAILLILLATTAFYDEPKRRRRSRPLYADVYLFHVGRRWGFHGALDFWPDRKEVLVSDAVDALRSINSHGITHLAVPDGPLRPVVHRYKEPESAMDRIKHCFVYGADGTVAAADVTICTSAAEVLKNYEDTLFPEQALAALEKSMAERTRFSGKEVEQEDVRRYFDLMRQRLDEVDRTDIAYERVRQRLNQAKSAGALVEHLRRIDTATALSMLG
jgi:hypothetical protein